MNVPMFDGGFPSLQLLGKSAEMPTSTGVVLFGSVVHVSSGSEGVHEGHSAVDGMNSMFVFFGSGVLSYRLGVTVEAAVAMIEGSARSMGLQVVGG